MLQIVGALTITLLLSRLILWLTRSWGDSKARFVFANGGVWLFAAIVGAFGHADGGPPNIIQPLILYGLACAVWLVVDLVRYQRGARDASRRP